MNNVILPNVTLAAIVRDERINPAGGIEDFLHCTMPFVGAGVLVDTGSLDGTLDILRDVSRDYPHMKRFRKRFVGYANARNYSLSKVRTPYVLILDADERLHITDFEKIKRLLRDNPDATGINFLLKDIEFDGPKKETYNRIHNPRLFRTDKGISYSDRKRCFEVVEFPPTLSSNNLSAKISINHFKPISTDSKYAVWYLLCEDSTRGIPAPSQTDGFLEWKGLNPQRANYHFGLPGYKFKDPLEERK